VRLSWGASLYHNKLSPNAEIHKRFAYSGEKKERLNSGHTRTDAGRSADRICSLARLISEKESADQKGGPANKEEGKLIKEKMLTWVRRHYTLRTQAYMRIEDELWL